MLAACLALSICTSVSFYLNWHAREWPRIRVCMEQFSVKRWFRHRERGDNYIALWLGSFNLVLFMLLLINKRHFENHLFFFSFPESTRAFSALRRNPLRNKDIQNSVAKWRKELQANIYWFDTKSHFSFCLIFNKASCSSSFLKKRGPINSLKLSESLNNTDSLYFPVGENNSFF